MPKPVNIILVVWGLTTAVLISGLIATWPTENNQIIEPADTDPITVPIEPSENPQLTDIEPPPTINLVSLNNPPSPTVKTGQPVVVEIATSTRPLTSFSLVNWFNQARQTAGQRPAASHSQLQAMAERLLNEGVDRNSLSQAALAVGYDYSLLAGLEAVGYFDHEQTAIEAWLASANRTIVLDSRLSHMGVATNFNHQSDSYETKIVVVVGRPPLNCPRPDPALIDRINRYDQMATEQYQAVSNRLEVFNQSTETNQLVALDLSNLINQYQATRTILAATMAEYNNQANSYNNCLRR